MRERRSRRMASAPGSASPGRARPSPTATSRAAAPPRPWRQPVSAPRPARGKEPAERVDELGMAATVSSALLREALQPQPQREERFVFLQQRGGGPGQRGGLRLMDGEQ